eukprot:2123413-Rhodomonas_salina.1
MMVMSVAMAMVHSYQVAQQRTSWAHDRDRAGGWARCWRFEASSVGLGQVAYLAAGHEQGAESRERVLRGDERALPLPRGVEELRQRPLRLRWRCRRRFLHLQVLVLGVGGARVGVGQGARTFAVTLAPPLVRCLLTCAVFPCVAFVTVADLRLLHLGLRLELAAQTCEQKDKDSAPVLRKIGRRPGAEQGN